MADDPLASFLRGHEHADAQRRRETAARIRADDERDRRRQERRQAQEQAERDYWARYYGNSEPPGRARGRNRG